ncbi:Alpha-tocopherol transfer protein-like protein [Trachymyrmex septentrionalis]|uniref:Alpha-tocopherol transfer protein-like protein n=1 Tax=Trachymyrmex septentrionalis TaxID=34720 RepID=A0A151JU22_9HYME|nr:Alpha-tocopherol transfer protein-like protein [Trachymyrmex septentrionalis]
MSRFGIFVLMLWSLLTRSYGFTMDRAVVFVPSAWDTAPSLDTYQRVFVDSAVKEMQVTDTNRILQTEDTKISENMLENQTREKKSTTEKVKMKLIEMKPINEIASAMRNDASDSSEENVNAVITPRNIILLLIDERDHEKKEENSWKDYKERLPFAIEGVLQNCHDKIENANFSMGNASTSKKKEKGCNCEHILLSNIEELLSWAAHTRGMTTGAVSSSNFSIPFFPKYESSSNKSNAKLELRKNKRDSNDGWQVIDLSDRTSSVSPSITKDSKTDGDLNYDTTWDIFDILSKIRMAFFRSLLESLHKNDGVSKNEFSSRKQSFLQSTPINLIEKTIRELKSISNDKGYMLVAVVPRSEGAAAVDLFQRETSLKNTLLIITQICVGGQIPVPFAAQGPNCQIFHEARVINELPILIKKAIITNDCYNTECMNRQTRDVPIELRLSTGIISQELPAEKRVVRNMNIEKLMLLIQPTEEMSKQIRVELNENVATRDKDLEMIKEWLAKQPHLPKFDDDQRIMTFLRGCKFSLEKCKRKLDMYFTMRAIVPEFFSNRDITRPALQEIIKLVHLPPLAGLTHKGCRVIVMRGIDKDVPTPNIPESMKIVFMIGDIRLKEEEHGVAGDVYILDAAAATPTHFAKFTPPVVKKFLICAMEAYPVKLKEVHVINISPLVDTILNFVKPFLKEKIRNRIFMHSDIKTLYDYIPREILPAEYGGDAGPIQNIHGTSISLFLFIWDMWMKKLEEYGPWFAEQEAMKTNEALRPGKPKTQDDLFGLDGSFRQLSID